MSEPVAAVPKPARNGVGIAALVVVLVAILLPGILGIVGFIATLLGPQQTQDTVGWGVLGGLIIAAAGLGAAGPIAFVGVILGIVALLRKGRSKVAAIIAIVLGVPLGVVGLLILPTAIDQMF